MQSSLRHAFLQSLLLHLFVRTFCAAVQPRVQLRDGKVCSSGPFTQMVSRAAGPKVASAKPLWRNAAQGSTAASAAHRFTAPSGRKTSNRTKLLTDADH